MAGLISIPVNQSVRAVLHNPGQEETPAHVLGPRPTQSSIANSEQMQNEKMSSKIPSDGIIVKDEINLESGRANE